jgi:hypothetical protein
MANNTIYFENPHNGQLREAPVGFSWTVFFFSCFPPIFRGDWKWFIIMFILAILTAGISGFVFIFIYNKLYIKELISSGYKVKSIEKGTIEDLSFRLGIKLDRIY